MLRTEKLLENLPAVFSWIQVQDDLMARRNGWGVASAELLLQRRFVKCSFLLWLTAVANARLRVPLRPVPRRLRTVVCLTVARSTPQGDKSGSETPG